MLEFYFTPILKWTEPKAFACFREASISTGKRLFMRFILFTIGFTGVFLAWGVKYLNPNLPRWSLTEVLIRAFALACFAAFIVPWMYSFGNSTIYFYNNKIWRSGPGLHSNWKYNEIAGWSISKQEIDGQSLPTLILRLHNGRLITLGLNESVAREQITQIFSEKNIPEQL